jgi:hypothetical protein
MAAAKRLALLSALACLFAPIDALTDDARQDSVQVHFAVLFDHDDPVAGDVTCLTGRECVLIDHDKPKLALRLTVDRNDDFFSSKMSVDCEARCSFRNERSNITFLGDGQFDVYEGGDTIETLLVLRPRHRIGQILLSYR